MWNPICFVGIDGSGKTTLAFKLITHLQRCNVRCRYLWFRQPLFLCLPLLAFCRAIRLTRVRGSGDLVWKEHDFSRRPLRLIWTLLQFLDAWSFSLMKVRLPMLLGYVVVCDRYIHDMLVDLMTDTGDHEIHNKSIGRLLLRLIPKSGIVFLVDVREDIAFQRKRDVPDIGYLRVRRRLYLELARSPNVDMVDLDVSIGDRPGGPARSWNIDQPVHMTQTSLDAEQTVFLTKQRRDI